MLELARAAAARGARVAICGREQTSQEAARQELSTLVTESVAVRCDVSDEEDVRRPVSEVRARLGDIDVLIAITGIAAISASNVATPPGGE